MAVKIIPVKGDEIVITDFPGQPSLAWLQATVGGYIEVVRSRPRKGEETKMIILDEEGKLKFKSLNPRATAIAHARLMIDTSDSIVGDVVELTKPNLLT